MVCRNGKLTSKKANDKVASEKGTQMARNERVPSSAPPVLVTFLDAPSYLDILDLRAYNKDRALVVIPSPEVPQPGSQKYTMTSISETTSRAIYQLVSITTASQLSTRISKAPPRAVLISRSEMPPLWSGKGITWDDMIEQTLNSNSETTTSTDEDDKEPENRNKKKRRGDSTNNKMIKSVKKTREDRAGTVESSEPVEITEKDDSHLGKHR